MCLVPPAPGWISPLERQIPHFCTRPEDSLPPDRIWKTPIPQAPQPLPRAHPGLGFLNIPGRKQVWVSLYFCGGGLRVGVQHSPLTGAVSDQRQHWQIDSSHPVHSNYSNTPSDDQDSGLIRRTEKEVETFQNLLDKNLMQSEKRKRRRGLSEQMGHQEKAASLC